MSSIIYRNTIIFYKVKENAQRLPVNSKAKGDILGTCSNHNSSNGKDLIKINPKHKNWRDTMKRIISILLVLAMGCSILSGCSGNSGDYTAVKGDILGLPTESTVEGIELKKMYNEFSINILKNVYAVEGKGSIMISPASILFALNMAALGAEGDTYTEMTNLYAKGATKNDIATFSKSLKETLESSGIVNVANSLWINEDKSYKANVEYLNLLRQYYSASAAQMSFEQTPELKDIINAWIKEKTNDMIENALDKIDPEAFMYIVNCLSFEGKWKEEYKDYQITYDHRFTSGEGKTQQMKSLNSTENLYLEYGGAKGFLKEYEGGDMSFVAILPDDENVSIMEFLNNCSEDFWTQFYDSRNREAVITLLPAFSFDYGAELREILMKMGMILPFTKDADLSGMVTQNDNTNDAKISPIISRIIHKTHIELDEKGTKAAAATIIEAVDGCTSVDAPAPQLKRVILDRPFIYAIVDNNTGLPIFMGVVDSLE